MAGISTTAVNARRKHTTSSSTNMNRIKLLLDLLKQLRMVLDKTYDLLLLRRALDHIGTDASPQDKVDDVLGCAESVTTILNKVRPTPIILGTWTLMDYLDKSPHYKRVTVPMPGNIIVSATGTGNGRIRGHTGIVGRNNAIMSNDSYTGKWMSNYTLATWRDRYERKGGIPTKFYSLIS